MGVEAHWLQVRAFEGPGQSPLRITGGDGKAKLGVEQTGFSILVGVNVDARRKAQPDGNRNPALRGQLPQHLQLVGIVHDHAPHTCVKGHGQLGPRLVVAVKVDPLRWKTGLEGDIELSARDHIQTQSLLGKKLGEGQV